jgi:capsular polysaccharide biosynthesis protein
MPIGEFFAVIRRRWLLVLVGVLLTVGITVGAYVVSKPTYEITGTVLLLPPASSADAANANPYLRLGGLNQAVDLVGVALTDQTTQLEMQAISKDVQYSVQSDVRTSSPLLLIDVKDSSPETALKIRDILVARVPVRLDAMQNALGVGTKDRVTTSVLTLDKQAAEVGKNRVRSAVVVGVVGLGLTLVIAALWDARRPRRRRSRARPLTPKKQVTEPDATGTAGSEPAEPQRATEAETTPEAETWTEAEPTEPAPAPGDEPTLDAEGTTDAADTDHPAEGIVATPVSPASVDGPDVRPELANASDDASR